MTQQKYQQPEILYEEEGLCSKFPFIRTNEKIEMPKVLFLFEMKESGLEEQKDGQILPVVDAIMHQFFSATKAKELLDEETYDKIRVAFGFKPLKEAMKSGAQITQKVKQNVEEAEKTAQKRKQEKNENKKDN